MSILAQLPDGVYLLQNVWDLEAFKFSGMWVIPYVLKDGSAFILNAQSAWQLDPEDKGI